MLVPLGVLAFAAVMLCTGSMESLAAKQLVGPDSDKDGIPDRQERVIGTSPSKYDTDGDGYSDGEELALHTSPTDSLSTPSGTGLSVGMSARGERGKLKLFVIVYDPDGDFDDDVIRFGGLVFGNLLHVPIQEFQSSEILVTPTQHGGTLFSMDIRVFKKPLYFAGAITYFAVVGEAGQGTYTSAAKVDLVMQHRIPVLRHVLKEPGQPAPGAPMSSTPGASASVPIPPSGDEGIPPDWTPEQICYQETEIVGVRGAVVFHQVISAECVDGWDSYCAPDCSETAGSQYPTVDPGVLIGG